MSLEMEQIDKTKCIDKMWTEKKKKQQNVVQHNKMHEKKTKKKKNATETFFRRIVTREIWEFNINNVWNEKHLFLSLSSFQYSLVFFF